MTAFSDRDKQNLLHWRDRQQKAGFINCADVHLTYPDKQLCSLELNENAGTHSLECDLAAPSSKPACLGSEMAFHRDGTICALCIPSGKGLGSNNEWVGGANDGVQHGLGICRTRQNEYIDFATDAYLETPYAKKTEPSRHLRRP